MSISPRSRQSGENWAALLFLYTFFIPYFLFLDHHYSPSWRAPDPDPIPAWRSLHADAALPWVNKVRLLLEHKILGNCSRTFPDLEWRKYNRRNLTGQEILLPGWTWWCEYKWGNSDSCSRQHITGILKIRVESGSNSYSFFSPFQKHTRQKINKKYQIFG